MLKHLRETMLVNSDLWRLASTIAVHRNDMQTAVQLIQKNRSPEDSKDYRKLLWDGRTDAEMNRPAEAEKKLRAALKLADKEPAPYWRWCNCWPSRSATRTPTKSSNKPGNGFRMR